MSRPRVSVITVVWNDAKGIERTIESILNQTYNNIEFIIIDGNSSDGTIDVIKKYERNIDYWVSEKDNGIYDAMNKGIEVSTGVWVNFMNAGDTFSDSEVLDKILFLQYSDKVLLYGNNICNMIEKFPLSPSLMKYGETFANHQSMFFSRKLLSKTDFYYDLSYKIYGDYELVNRIYLKYPKQFTYLDLCIANFEGGGISSKVSTQKRKDKYRAVYNNYGLFGLLRALIYRVLLELKQ